MPRKAKATSYVSPSKSAHVHPANGDWGGFIECRLTEADKNEFAVWSVENAPHMWTDFQELVSRGFKFSLSYDADGDFYLSTFTAKGEDLIGIDLRCCLTARAPEWEQSILLLLFKHLVMAQENWGSYRPSSNRFDRLG